MNDHLRKDCGKVRLDLLPAAALIEAAKVFTFGAEKYAPNAWREGMAWSRCIGSLKRHLAKFEMGVDFDDESRLLHLAHIAVNVLFLLEYHLCELGTDDRVKLSKLALDKVNC